MDSSIGDSQKTTNRTPCDELSHSWAYFQKNLSQHVYEQLHEGIDKEMVAHIHYGGPQPQVWKREKMSKKVGRYESIMFINV